ncbi:protein lethal(2)denticleless [Bombus vosnesenskii]|uniref:Protein lethal(2)denticleless n=2 Tax=Pyrobombus TaxID=144703 RepID=A0A6J3K3S8_9HYME|nr:protein lethal(2)denticleless [Bombus vancouverensis nearcticus]XP_033306366.1 protein lethal(2)denticleless [Bombus bifarius]XP_033346904.1 protein lethal(2)denticleless [Bombus vosnesenskii]XP_050478298.1 protein lethal(2)denticleless [Bombus huntii]
MNLVHSIVEREKGSASIHDYDVALYRLKCYKDDVYKGITPNTDALDFNPEPPVFACRFCTTKGYEQIIALANEDGKIALQDTDIKSMSNQPLEGTQAHRNAIFDVAWMPGELKLVTASGDHTARLWDVSGSEIRQIDCFHAHIRSVKTAVFRYQDQAVFATGARDGSIMIWDIRANHYERPKPDNCIINAHNVGNISNVRQRRVITQSSRAQSITGLVFQDDFTLISCSAGDGLIKVWDLRKNYTVHKKDPLAKHTMNYTGHSTRNGFSSLLICPATITLYASCMDNIIYAYNISSYNPKPIAEFYGHQNRTYYVKSCLSPDGRYLASGSSDELAYIWHTNKPGAPIVQLLGHTEEVTCIAWSSVRETKIVTCSDDSCHRIWRVGHEHKLDNEEIEIRGRAEAIFNKNPLENLKLETTPTITRRWVISQEHTPGSDTTPNATPGPSSSDAYNQVEDSRNQCNVTTSMKRNYFQMMSGSWSDGKFKSVLSPIQENLTSARVAKRIHLENRGARRLFSPCNDNSSSLNRGYESDEPSTSSSSRENRNNEIHFSPTLNLPNFVIDGTAPHLLQLSPEKYKENVDWLTRIRREKYGKVRKTLSEKSASPVSCTVLARRNTRSRSTEPQKVSKMPRNSPLSLLNFFKVTGKDCETNMCCDDNVIPSAKS